MTVKSLRLDWNSEGQKYLTEDFSGLWPAGEPSAPGEAPNLPCQKHQLHPSAPSCHHCSIPYQLQHSCCTSTSLLKAFRENVDKDLSTDTEHFSKKHEMFWRENPQPGSVSAAAVSVAAGKQRWRGHFTRSQAAWTCPRCFLFIPHFSLCIFSSLPSMPEVFQQQHFFQQKPQRPRSAAVKLSKGSELPHSKKLYRWGEINPVTSELWESQNLGYKKQEGRAPLI